MHNSTGCEQYGLFCKSRATVLFSWAAGQKENEYILIYSFYAGIVVYEFSILREYINKFSQRCLI